MKTSAKTALGAALTAGTSYDLLIVGLRERVEELEQSVHESQVMVATHEDVVRERDHWRAKYEALLAKATLPADVLSWASAVTVGPGAMRDAARAAERFLLALHAATKSEPPKRKTRQQAASDYYRAKYGECDEYMLREGLVAAGVNPDEVVSEAP